MSAFHSWRNACFALLRVAPTNHCPTGGGGLRIQGGNLDTGLLKTWHWRDEVTNETLQHNIGSYINIFRLSRFSCDRDQYIVTNWDHVKRLHRWYRYVRGPLRRWSERQASNGLPSLIGYVMIPLRELRPWRLPRHFWHKRSPSVKCIDVRTCRTLNMVKFLKQCDR